MLLTFNVSTSLLTHFLRTRSKKKFMVLKIEADRGRNCGIGLSVTWKTISTQSYQ